MSYHTVEHKIDSMRGWKRPLYTGKRVYRSTREVKKRIGWLCREYGDENIVHMPDKCDSRTEIVFVRVK